MATEYVPLRDLPDLRAGDLMLVRVMGGSSEYPLYITEARAATWCHDFRRSRQGASFDTSMGDNRVQVLTRLRGVERADLADDRWPETERRLRGATAEPAQQARLKVGERIALTRESLQTLPPNTLVRVFDGRNWSGHVLTGDDLARWCDEKGVRGKATPWLEMGRFLTIIAHDVEPTADGIRAALARGSVAVGDRVTAEQIAALPPGTVVRRDLGDVWQIGPNRKARPALLCTSESPRLLEFAAFNSTAGGTIIALDAPLGDDRRALLEHVAAAGDEQAHQALQAAVQAAAPKAKARPPLKPGDRVEGRWDELPPGSVVDTLDGTSCSLLTRCTKSGWSWSSVITEDPGPVDWVVGWGTPHPTHHPEAVFVGVIPLKASGDAYVRALADLGYEPARKALRQTTPAEPERPVVRVGDEVTDWSQLPDGAVVAASDTKELALYRDGKRMWLRTGHGHWYQSVGGWCDAMRPISGRVVALCPANCTPAQAREIVERLEGTHAQPQRDDYSACEMSTFADALDEFAEATQALLDPLPAPGDRIDGKDLARLPVGAVVDTHDGTNAPWATKCPNGCWAYVTSWAFEEQLDGMWGGEHMLGMTVVAFDAPPPGPALRAWCAARGYEPAVALKREIAAEQARKQIVDAEPAAVQTEEMAMQTITIELGGVKCAVTQNPGEEQGAFLARVADVKRALDAPAHQAQDRSPAMVAQIAPSALARIGSALGQLGGDFAKDALSAVVDQKALALVDVSRVGGGKAVVAIAELFGDKAALKALRAVQSPLAPVVVDGVVAVGASLLGARGLAQVTRGRFVRRVVEGTGEAIVERGVGVVTQLAQTVGALAAAATSAAELTEGAADAQANGEVQGA